MAISKQYWEELGVSIGDILAKQAEMEEKIFQSLAKKLDSLSPDFLTFVKDAYKIGGDSLIEVLQSLHSRSKPDFVELYALAVFAEKNINPEIIYEGAAGKLQGDTARRVSERTIDSSVVLLPLLKADPESIRKIYYSYNIQRSALKKYVCYPPISSPASFESLTFKRIENLLKEFENKKRPKLRRPIKLWWFDVEGGRVTIVFRREKSANSN